MADEKRKLEKLMTVSEAAEFLDGKISGRTVQAALRDGKLRGCKVGGTVGWLTSEEAIVEWLQCSTLFATKA